MWIVYFVCLSTATWMTAQCFHAILQEQRCCYHYQVMLNMVPPSLFHLFSGEESGSGERADKLSRWKPIINHEHDTGDFPFYQEFLLRKESMSVQWSIASPHCTLCDVLEFYALNDPCVALYQRYGNGWLHRRENFTSSFTASFLGGVFFSLLTPRPKNPSGDGTSFFPFITCREFSVWVIQETRQTDKCIKGGRDLGVSVKSPCPA